MQQEPIILSSQQVDRTKWDACINNSSNGLIYATCDYLDHMADNWSGIVVNDYEAVMPVPWRKKLGIKYCYHVPFIQQLGLFSSAKTHRPENMVHILTGFVSYGDYFFNYGNDVPGLVNDCINYILPLNCSYAILEASFATDILQDMKKASSFGLKLMPGSVSEAIGMYKELYSKRMPHVTSEDYRRFEQLAHQLEKQHKTRCYKVIANTGKTVAVSLLLRDADRLYNIINAVTIEGREVKANHFLLSNIWKEFENSGLIFDFEGSDIPAIKAFYQKFGAVNQPYGLMHFNHLPSAIRWLKR